MYRWYLFDQECSDSSDFRQSEMFWVVICFGIFIVLSFTCLLALICKKYRNMKHNYDRLLENPGRSSDMRVGQGIGEVVDHGEVELSNV